MSFLYKNISSTNYDSKTPAFGIKFIETSLSKYHTETNMTDNNTLTMKVLNEIEALIRQGVETIRLDSLRQYLRDLIQPESQTNKTNGLNDELHIEQYRYAGQSRLEMFKSVILAGQNAIRAGFIMNGGAAISILTFVGHLTIQKLSIDFILCAMLTYATGVFFMALTAASTYISQWLYSSQKEPLIVWGRRLNVSAIILGLIGHAAFPIGCYFAYLGIRAIKNG